MAVAVAWIIFGASVAFVLLCSFIFTKYYEDRYENEAFLTIITTIALSLAFFTVLLIPVDIYMVSSTVDPKTGIRVQGLTEADIQQRSASVKVLYYILYCSMFAFSFIVAPFAYFFYEEGNEVPVKSRIWAGIKYTIFLVIIIIVLLIIGLFLNGANTVNTNDTNAKKFIENLFDTSNKGQAAIEFAVACLALLGYVLWIAYAAYGFSAFPFSFLRSNKSTDEEKEEISSEMRNSREKRRLLTTKSLTGRLSRKDQKEASNLERQQRVLVRRHEKLEKVSGCLEKVTVCCRPFSIIFGIVFLLISLLIIISLALTNINKISNNVSNFVLKYPTIFNPIDTILTFFAKYFPLDYAIFSAMVLFIFMCIFAGIIGIGVRFFWVHMYEIRKGSSAPQGLLLGAIFAMLCILAFNFELVTLSPQYSSFGSQTFYNETTKEVVRCSIQLPSQNCTMTQLASIVNRMSIRMTFFGVVFYFGTWIFLGFWLLGLVVAICLKKRSWVDKGDDDSDDDSELYGNKTTTRRNSRF